MLVFWIRICMVLGLLDPDLLVRGMNPDPTSKNSKKRLIPTALWHLFDVLSGVPDLWHFMWIRISGSMTLTNGPGSGRRSGFCHFRHWPRTQKTNYKDTSLGRHTNTTFRIQKKAKEVTKQ